MKKVSQIVSLFLAVGLCSCGAAGSIPVDDVYYVRGNNYKVQSTQMPLHEKEGEEAVESSASQPEAPQCTPAIRFTVVQDTTVTAIIKRCE